MPSNPKLKLLPDDVSESEAMLSIIPPVSAYFYQSYDSAIYGMIPGDVDEGAFIARSPTEALRWICKRVSRPALLKVVQHYYDFPDTLTEVEEATCQDEDTVDVEGADEPKEAEHAGTRGIKRKRPVKEKTTREANRNMVEKMNMALVQTVASSQDRAIAREPTSLSAEEQRYRNFAKKLPGAGIDLVTTMINKAVSVGSLEVLRDWQAILKVWNMQARHQRKLFDPINVPDGIPMSTELSVFHRENNALALPSQTHVDEVGLTSDEKIAFRHRFFDAQKTQVDGIASDMRHRWKMDMLYEDYDRLEKKIRKKAEGSGGRGRRYAVIAKEHLFAMVYEDEFGSNANKDELPELWKGFGQFLDWGKRWNVMKKRFDSVGIFALLPRSVIPNAYIEKSLSQTRVGQWIEMLAECNPDVQDLTWKMEPLFLACMHGGALPAEYEFLAELEEHPQESAMAVLGRLNIPSSSLSSRQSGRITSVMDSDSEG